MTFEAWYEELLKVARENHMEYLVADMESHRDGYEDGLSPLDELMEQGYAAAQSL